MKLKLKNKFSGCFFCFEFEIRIEPICNSILYSMSFSNKNFKPNDQKRGSVDQNTARKQQHFILKFQFRLQIKLKEKAASFISLNFILRFETEFREHSFSPDIFA